MRDINNNYFTRIQSNIIKSDIKFFKLEQDKQISLDDFKNKYFKLYYSDKEIEKLRNFFNIGPYLIRLALTKRFLLNKFLIFKYYAAFSTLKTLPNKWRRYKRRKVYFFKKKRKKLNFRTNMFLKINSDNFLFYLKFLDKQLIIQPFNFLISVFFYKTRKFKKYYSIRKRKRFKFRYYYKILRYRRRYKKRLRKYSRHKKKKKILMKRFRLLKIRSVAHFFRFMAFLQVCKKINLKSDDLFKVKSIAKSHYNLLKFSFNKLTNSYRFFMNFRKRKLNKNQISFFIKNNLTLNFNKSKVYHIIKSNLIKRNNLEKKANNIILSCFNDKINSHNINKINFFYYHIFYFLIQKLLFEFDFSKIILNNFNINIMFNLKQKINSINIKNTITIKILKKIIFLIFSINKKLKYYNKLLCNLKKKQKKLINLNIKNSNENEIIFINELKIKYNLSLDNFFYIINKLQFFLEELIVNFYIFFIKYKNLYKNNQNIFYFKNKKYFRKLKYFFKYKKSLTKKKKKYFSFLLLKKKSLFYKLNTLPFSFKNKINNKSKRIRKRKIQNQNFRFRRRYLTWWRLRKLQKRRNRKKKKRIIRNIITIFPYNKLGFYKNFYNYKTNLFVYFLGKKLKYTNITFLKKSNKTFSYINQINKNFNFLYDN